jgi:hypothetical protein
LHSRDRNACANMRPRQMPVILSVAKDPGSTPHDRTSMRPNSRTHARANPAPTYTAHPTHTFLDLRQPSHYPRFSFNR